MTNNNFFDFSNLLGFIYNKRKHLIIITLIAGIISAIVSLTIDDKYKSTVIMFPVSTNSISKALLSEINVKGEDVMAFGEEEQAEQLMQILNSDEIRSRIVQKFNLMNHYDIDSTSKYKFTKLFKEYESNITIKRTEYMSVRVDVLDTKPQMAADIANEICNLVDSVQTRMQRERSVNAFKIVEAEYLDMQNYIKKMEDSLTVLRSLGIQDYESQSEVLTEQLAISITKDNKRAINEIKQRLDILSKYGGAYVSIRDALEYDKKQLSDLRVMYKDAKIDAEADLPHKFVVNRAFSAEKKSYPIRWLIVFVSMISTFLLALIILIVFEDIKKKDFHIERT